mmetsp:Transcript_67545/g.100159  ORF Transcript_67545/g.100159 Transcript_67545/m.100159 type:complete len:170 (-) Transcript_67545:272-781(-)
MFAKEKRHKSKTDFQKHRPYHPFQFLPQLQHYFSLLIYPPSLLIDVCFCVGKKGNVCCPFPLNLGETTGTLFSAAAVVAEWNKVDDGTSLCGGVGGGSSSTICDPSLLSKHVISLEILVVAREGAGVLIEERETVNDPVKSDKFNFISDDVMLGMTTCGEALEDASFCA